MAEILTDLSPSSLASANKANLFSLFLYLEKSSKVEFIHIDGLVHWHSTHPFYWFSDGVLCSRNALSTDNVLIDELIAYYRSKQAKSICWWVEESVSRTSWEKLLAPRGFKFVDGPPGMGVDLTQLPENIPTPAGLEIHIVNDNQTLQPYNHLLRTVFEFPPETENRINELAQSLGFDMPLISYIAYLNGSPVGTSAVYYGASVAGIYNVAVTPEARGKGIGAMITLQPLRDALKLGYRAGILQASDMGFKVYQRLGFKQNFQLGWFQYNFEGNN